ncbi:hypothetical protein ACQKMD_11030 [Viridibacillus sp. NPDC096237]|uniref:hypothetical protein n=1 Tax=Viridibacillus sp. NPDC096237 TaxID=3390721 RepID=UPI003D07E163
MKRKLTLKVTVEFEMQQHNFENELFHWGGNYDDLNDFEKLKVLEDASWGITETKEITSDEVIGK